MASFIVLSSYDSKDSGLKGSISFTNSLRFSKSLIKITKSFDFFLTGTSLNLISVIIQSVPCEPVKSLLISNVFPSQTFHK